MPEVCLDPPLSRSTSDALILLQAPLQSLRRPPWLSPGCAAPARGARPGRLIAALESNERGEARCAESLAPASGPIPRVRIARCRLGDLMSVIRASALVDHVARSVLRSERGPVDPLAPRRRLCGGLDVMRAGEMTDSGAARTRCRRRRCGAERDRQSAMRSSASSPQTRLIAKRSVESRAAGRAGSPRVGLRWIAAR